MTKTSISQQQHAATIVRGLAMDAVQKANSGHPGLPMGMADAAVVLWTQFLTYDPAHPHWPNRDRFVLSAGHGSMLLYSLLHLSGYDVSLDDLKQFRQWGSKTPGHPESDLTPGVETTTGPLGQGFGNAVGLALAEAWLATKFNRPGFPLVDHHTYVIASDGDLMEGISHEAASLAGHLGLGKLIVLYDDNNISIDGPTDLTFTEDVRKRFEAYGWQTLAADGHDIEDVAGALSTAKEETKRPTLIACRTTIGFGSPNRAGTAKAHGEPLGEEEVRLSKEQLGLPIDQAFYVPNDVYAFMAEAGKTGANRHAVWHELRDRYAKQYPELAEAYEKGLSGEAAVTLDTGALFEAGKAMASRNTSGIVLAELFEQVPNLIGGSADLTPSNKTRPSGTDDIQGGDFAGRYIRFGVREHAMGAILNGLALHGGIRPYGGTFLVFSDYMRPAIRLAALMHLPVIYVFTHDSIGVGEDGPTHQPIEHLMALRAIPNLTVIRPADGVETAAAWKAALENRHGPTALILSRQNLPDLGTSLVGAESGAYVLAEATDASGVLVVPEVILIGTGSETQLAVAAREMLADEGIAARVVSMPSWELFAKQNRTYQHDVLPPGIRARVSVEAGITSGWERYVGLDGRSIGIDRFGASAPQQRIYEELGVTAEAVAEAARTMMSREQ